MNQPKKKVQSSSHLLKFISLVMSVTLWFYVLNSEPLELERKIPLVLIPPAGKAVNVQVPDNITVKVKGSRAFVKNLFFQKEKVFLDIKKYPHEQETFAVTFDSTMIPVPFGVEVLEIKPEQIMLSLEKEIKKYVPIRVKLVGEVSKDLRLVKRDHEPKQILIQGPRSVLKKIGQLSTIPLDLSTLEGEGFLKVPLEGIDERVLVKDKVDILFKYLIQPNKANKSLKQVPIRFISSRPDFTSKIKTADLEVLVPDDWDEENMKDLRILADIPLNQKGNVEVKLKVELPDGVNLLQIRPQYINVFVK